MAKLSEFSKAPVEFDWDEIARALFRERNINTGLWRIGVRFQFAAINSGPSDSEILPSMLAGVHRIVLSEVPTQGPLVFDAAMLNPATGRTKLGSASRRKAGDTLKEKT